MARQLLLLAGVAAQTVTCGGTAEFGGACDGVDFSGTTDIITHGHGFIALDRNYGKAKCVGGKDQSETDAACDAVDWAYALPGVEVITAPSCASVVMVDKEAGTGKCVDLTDPNYECEAVDFRGVDTVLLAGGAKHDATADENDDFRFRANRTCSGVAWSKEHKTVECFGFNGSQVEFLSRIVYHGGVANCSMMDWSATTHIFSNDGGAWVSLDAKTGDIMCWGDDAVGGNCTDVMLPVTEGGKYMIYPSGTGFMGRNEKTGEFVCWGHESGGGNCTGLGVGRLDHSMTVIYGSEWGYAAYDAEEKLLYCSYFACNTTGADMSDVTAIFPSPTGFVALQPSEDPALFCLGILEGNAARQGDGPEGHFVGCNVTHEAGAGQGVDSVVSAGSLNVAYNMEHGPEAGVICFGFGDDSSSWGTWEKKINKTHARDALEICWRMDFTGTDTLVTSGAEYTRVGGLIAYGGLVPVDPKALIEKRYCFARAGVEPEATGDVLSHTVVVKGGSYGVNGEYLQQPDGSFLNADETWSMEWDGCKWFLSRSAVLVNLTCVDDVAAANELFGNSFQKGGTVHAMELGVGFAKSSKFDEDICSAGHAMGYCSEAVFAAVCAAQCKSLKVEDGCTEDSDDAMANFAEFHGKPAMTCAQASGFCATSKVVKAICKKTCMSDDYVDTDVVGKFMYHEEFNDAFAMAGRRMFRMDSRDISRRLKLQKARSPVVVEDHVGKPVYVLGTEAGFRVPADAVPGVCDKEVTIGESRTAIDKLSTGVLCDLTTLGMKTDYSLEYVCEEATFYSTVTFAYCPWVNVDVQDAVKYPTLFERRCNTTEDATSNALCMSREECEAACTELGDECIGFDFKIGADMCFLNRAEGHCTSDEVVDAGDGQIGFRAPETFKPGMRYADAHVPTMRRLEHEELWMHHDFVFARKQTETFVSRYETHSEMFCVSDNAPLNQTGHEIPGHPGVFWEDSLCTVFCEKHGAKGILDENATDFERALYGCDHLDELTESHAELSGVPGMAGMRGRMANEALCVSREMCELYCDQLGDDCVSIDMSREYQHCYINTKCDRLVPGKHHDLLIKKDPLSCFVNVSHPDIDVEGVVGKYHPTGAADEFFNFDEYEETDDSTMLYFTWRAGCGFELRRMYDADPATLEILFLAYADPLNCSMDDTANYTEEEFTGLYVAKCLGQYGMASEYFCDDYEPCHALGYCVLSSERMAYELAAMRKNFVAIDQPLCMAEKHVKQMIMDYEPKIIADETRVEFVYDSRAFFGEDALYYGTDAHYLHQEIFRDAIKPPRVRIQSLGSKALRGAVTMVSPADDVAELGVMFTPPEGYARWVSDIMRIERFDQDGMAVGGEIVFEMYLPAAKGKFGKGEPLALFASVDGTFKDVLTLGAKIEASPLHHEEHGWVMVTLPEGFPASFTYDGWCGLIDLVAAVDENECAAEDLCDENAECVNLHPGYKCVCEKGWVPDGDGQCVADTVYTVPLRVRVETDVEMPWGWRLQEVQLFEDAECKKPLVVAAEKSFLWKQIDDRYCIGNNLGAGKAPGYVLDKDSTAEVKEYLAELASYKCVGGKLADAAGLYDKSVDTTSDAYCMSAAKCRAMCAFDPACTGVDMHEYLPRCYLNYDIGEKSCSDQVKENALGDDHDYYFLSKELHLEATASSYYEDHWPALASDNNIVSEWWTGLHNVAPNSAYFELKISGRATVGSAMVMQSPRHSASRYRVSVGPDRKSLFDHPTDVKHVQHAEAGAFVEDRSMFAKTVVQPVENEMAPCLDLTCGDDGVMFEGEVVTTFPFAESACHCKQLCLDHVDEGCRSYVFKKMDDTNFDATPAYHSHTGCTLFTSIYDMSKGKKHYAYISGGVDLLLMPLEMGAMKGGPFTLGIDGVGFPKHSSKQRAKVVEKGEPCSAAPAATVEGISCTEPTICHPKPSSATAERAEWMLDIAAKDTDAEYEVCYCAGPCFAASHWTKVPGSFMVEGHGLTYTTSVVPTRYVSFDIMVDAAVSSLSFVLPVEGEAVNCSLGVGNITNKSLGVFEVEPFAWHSLDFGDYVVCLDNETAWPLLTIVPEFPKDATRVSGIYADQAWTSPTPSNKAPIVVSGTLLSVNSTASIALTTSKSCAAAQTDAIADWDPAVWMKLTGDYGLIRETVSCTPPWDKPDATCVKCPEFYHLATWDKPCCPEEEEDACTTLITSEDAFVLDVELEAGVYTVCHCDTTETVESIANMTMRRLMGNMTSNTTAAAPLWEPEGLTAPSADMLALFEISKEDILGMTLPSLLAETDELVFEPSIVDVLATNGVTKADAILMFTGAFMLTNMTFDDISYGLTGREEIATTTAPTTAPVDAMMTNATNGTNGTLDCTNYTPNFTSFDYIFDPCFGARRLSRRLVDPEDFVTNHSLFFPNSSLAILEEYGITIVDLVWAAAVGVLGKAADNATIDLYSMDASEVFGSNNAGEVFMFADALRRKLEGRALDDHKIMVSDGTGPILPEWATEPPKYASWTSFFKSVADAAVKWPGGACGSPAEYTKDAGKLSVTARADLGLSYVVEPGGPASIEITGKDLKPWADRIMVVNCQDTCGQAMPSPSVGFPDGGFTGAFSYFEPVRDLAEYGDCPYVNYTENPYSISAEFEEVASRYCVSTPVDTSDSNPAVIDVIERHKCGTKCTQPCVGDHCYCDGNIGSDDSFVADAICLPKFECEHLCKLLGDACHSVNMHKSLPRCFLNSPKCAGQEKEHLGLNLDYSLLVKGEMEAAPAVRIPTPELEDINWDKSSRGDLVPGEGWSTASVLRFAPMSMPSAGTYKVCFCDSDLADCDTKEAYSVEIGKMHVSGLSCLLSVPKLRTAQCFEQYFGGLRCVPE